MTRRAISAAAALAGLCLSPPVSSASVLRLDPRDGLAASPPSGAVGELSHSGGDGCTAVAILGGAHALTTRHCVTEEGAIDGPTVEPGSLRFEAGGGLLRGVALFADFDADLALVRLDGRAPETFDLWDPAFGSEVGAVFVALGFGATDPDGDGRWGPAGRGVQRTFSNVFDEARAGGLAGQGEVLRYDYDLTGDTPVGEFEGLHGPGDSGAAALVEVGGERFLAGIASSSGDPVNGASGSFVRLGEYRDEILAIVVTVPEPTSWLLVLVAAAGHPLCRASRSSPPCVRISGGAKRRLIGLGGKNRRLSVPFIRADFLQETPRNRG